MQCFRKFLTVLCVVAWGFASQVIAQELEVQVGFEPDTIVQGDRCFFVIKLNKVETLDYSIPKVNGMRLLGPEVRQYTTIVNNKTYFEHSLVYDVETDVPGVYVIPEFKIKPKTGDTFFTVKERKLTVLEQANGRTGKELFSELRMNTEKIYVGQTIPFSILVYFSPSIELDKFYSLGKVNGEGFSEPNFNASVAVSGSEIRDNKTYTVVRWPSLFYALKSGKHELGFSSGFSIFSNDGRNRRDPFGNDPFFNNSPFGMNSIFRETERRTLKTPMVTVDVLPLPEKDKPKSFTGGIGLFSVKSEVSTREVAVGDPITYRLVVEGEGNFERMTVPELNLDKDWISRNVSSDTTFSDRIGFKGKRVFEYALVPRNNSIKEIPAVAFSYFIPEEGKYEEITLPAIAIKVTGANPVSSTVSVPEETQGKTEQEESKAVDQNSPINDPGIGWGSLVPFYLQSKFVWHIPILLACVFIYVVLKYPRYRERKRPEVIHQRQFNHAMKQILLRGKKAAQDKDAVVLSECFMRSLQHWVAFYKHCSPDSLTEQEIINTLAESKLDAACKVKATETLASLNAHRYGTRKLSETDVGKDIESLQILCDSLAADVAVHCKTLQASK